jgi:hypothetical protein
MMGGVGAIDKEIETEQRRYLDALRNKTRLLEDQNRRKAMRGMPVSEFAEIDRYSASIAEGGGDLSYFPEHLKAKHAAAVQSAFGDRPFPNQAAFMRARDAEEAVRESNRLDKEGAKFGTVGEFIEETKQKFKELPLPIGAAIAAITALGHATAEAVRRVEESAQDMGGKRVKLGAALQDLGYSAAEQDAITKRAESGGFGKNITYDDVVAMYSSAARGARSGGFQLQSAELRAANERLISRVGAGEVPVGTAVDVLGGGPFSEVGATLRRVGTTGRGALSLNAQERMAAASNIRTTGLAPHIQAGFESNIQQAGLDVADTESWTQSVVSKISETIGLRSFLKRATISDEADPTLDVLKKIENKTPGPLPPSTNSGAGLVR